MREKGKFFWKKKWYSICSMHYEYNKDCNMCRTGVWKNVWSSNISEWIFDNFPNFWRWYVNLNKYKRINSIKEEKHERI